MFEERALVELFEEFEGEHSVIQIVQTLLQIQNRNPSYTVALTIDKTRKYFYGESTK
jgi:hypothetical protein